MELENLSIWAYIGAALVVAFITICIYLLKKFSDKVSIFIRDTLKEKQPDGTWKWSKTALTMASAWYAVLYSYFYDLIQNGFHTEAFLAMMAVAIGAPVSSAYSKKLKPSINPPKDETTQP